MDAIERVTATVRRQQPDLTDSWEVMALIESAGYSDRRIQQEFGFDDVRELAGVVYKRLRQMPAAPAAEVRRPEPRDARHPLVDFAGNFSSSIVYAIPWLAIFWIEHIHPDAFMMPASLTAPLMLALMASLVGAGGFVQGIARKGVFYTSMGERAVAQRVTRRLFELGALLAVVAGGVSLVAGWYFQMFPLPELTLATAFYVTLSLLWMVCALITYEGRRWRVPVIFLAAAIVFVQVLHRYGATVLANMAGTYAALLAGALFVAADYLRDPRALPPYLPNMRVLLHSIAPYFWYGVLYFSLLFADRLVAATARLLTGADFSVGLPYAHATDVALVSFLVMAAVVEHLNCVFMRSFREEMRRRPSTDPVLRRVLLRRHLLFLLLVVVAFPIVDALCRLVSVSLRPLALGPGGWQVLVIASAGYLFLCAALLNSLILLSLNRPGPVVSAFVLALAIDVVLGAVCATLFGIPFAALGLAAGAAVLAIRTTGKVAGALSSPAYAYCAS